VPDVPPVPDDPLGPESSLLPPLPVPLLLELVDPPHAAAIDSSNQEPTAPILTRPLPEVRPCRPETFGCAASCA